MRNQTKHLTVVRIVHSPIIKCFRFYLKRACEERYIIIFITLTQVINVIKYCQVSHATHLFEPVLSSMACSAWVTMLNMEESSCTLRLSSSLLRCSGVSSLARSAPMAGAWAGARVRCSGLEWTISDAGRGACQESRGSHHTCHVCRVSAE